MGVEKVAEEVATFLPQARIGLMSSDHITTPQKLKNLIADLENQKIDVLIGTQMVAKGHHFPLLTCVGVLDGDAGLHGIDFRAHEHLIQLLTQVSGRAGRGETPGEVYIQTAEPQHPLFQILASHQLTAWRLQEIENRKRHLWPPEGRLIALILSGSTLSDVQGYALRLSKALHGGTPSGVRILGPTPAPLAFLRNKHRWRFLVQSPRTLRTQPFVDQILDLCPPPSSINVQVDVDPYTFF
jgi:primosomal protein N' (replication factor Y)